MIFGDDGKLVLPNPWLPQGSRQGLETSDTVERHGRDPETINVRAPAPTYCIQAEWVASTLPAIQPVWPAMSWDDSIGNSRVLDAWRAALRSD